ncbi:hypothetical protein [Mucilaginibacter sp. CSA2-8R]|uniref:hypothetical protein n=1 Tax=Mucilaginibacter sp. CSA2-8R TaxID=3141542 RepID=UPI00315DA142
MATCKNKAGNELNICVYGVYKPDSYIAIKLDGNTVYSKTITDNKFSERRLPAIFTYKNKALITLMVNDKDTTFTCNLEKKNYLNMAFSIFQNQFQVVRVDSLTYQKSGDDVIY